MKALLKHIGLVLLLAAISPTLSAQSYSYLGKRYLAEYEFGIFPSLTSVSAKGKSIVDNKYNAKRGLGMDINHKIKVSAIMGRKSSLYAAFSLSKTGVFVDHVFPILGEFNYTGIFYHLNSKGYEVGVSLHSNRKPISLSPIGPHFDLGLQIIQTKGTPKNILANPSFTRTDTSVKKTVNGMLTLKFGNRHIWLDRILFSYGIKSGLILARPANSFALLDSHPSYDRPDFEEESARAYAKKYFKQRTTARLQASNLFRIYVGFGYLIF